MSETISIAGRVIGPGRPVYMIAEISGNHNQSFEEAKRLVRAAKDAGADAVKMQTYTADTLTIDCDEPCFKISGGTPWDGQTLHKLYGQAYTPWDWQPKLKELADDIGITLFSSPFDASAVDFLEKIDVPAHKIASFELVDLPLLRKVASTGKPIIMSTGLASSAEIDEAVATVRAAGGRQLALLKCTSAYPARPEEMNLRTIVDLRERFNVPIGLSDHTLGITVPVAAVALGACIVEKHFTLSRSQPGPDTAFSLEPQEFRAMVHAVREAEQSLGKVTYEVSEKEARSRIFRRSLFVVDDMRAGDAFTELNVRSIRPGYGLHTRHLPEIVGKRAAKDIRRGTPMDWNLVAK